MKQIPQIDKLFMPWESGGWDFGTEEIPNGPKKDWLHFILEFTKRTEAGKWNQKYGVMIFKANYGYQSAMKKIVDDCVKQMKKEDPNVIVMDETDDDKVKTWVVGNKDKIQEMVDDELKAPFSTP